MKRSVLISELAAFCLCLMVALSCSHDGIVYSLPEFKTTKQVKFEVMSEALPYNGVSRIHLIGDYLVIDALDILTKESCHVYRTEDFTCVSNSMAMGRGPMELIGMHYSQAVGSRCCFTDINKNTTLSFFPDSLVAHGMDAIDISYTDVPTWEKMGLLMGDCRLSMSVKSPLATVDTAGVARLMIFDECENLVNSLDIFPETDMTKNWQNSYSMTASPDMTKFAIASLWSGVLEFYDYPTMATRSILYCVPPLFNSEGSNLKLTEETKSCFSSICSSNKYLYAIFDGVSPVLKFPKFERNHNIDIYDWDGNPVKRYITDYRIESIAVAEEDDLIYALVSDCNDELYIAKLNLTDDSR